MSTKKINKFSDFGVDSIRNFIDKHFAQLIYFLAFVIVVIFLTIFVISRKNEKIKNLIVDYYKAIDYIKNDNSEEGLDILDDIFKSKYANEDIKTISGMKIAEILNKKNKKDEAIDIYKKLYNFKKNDSFLRNLSGLSALNILINENNPDNYQEIQILINTLSNPNNPLFLLVKEQEGLFEIQKGNLNDGLKILNELLINNDLDNESRTRIESIINIYKNENL